MERKKKAGRGAGEAEPGGTQGGRRPTGVPPTEPGVTGPLAPNGRWSAGRKRDVVLRLLQGESLDAVSREIGVEVYRLEKWREQALAGMDARLKRRKDDTVQAELDGAMRRIGELTMDNELLWRRVRERVALCPAGGRRNEPGDLAVHRQALWGATGMPDLGAGSLHGVCSAPARARAKDRRQDAPEAGPQAGCIGRGPSGPGGGGSGGVSLSR